MGLDLSLRIAMTGLRAVQQGLDVVSRNVANSDTPGYTKKTLEQNAVLEGGENYGVRTGNLKRDVDKALQKEVYQQESDVEKYGTLKSYLTQIEELHGDPEEEESLGNRIGTLTDSFTKLMDTPDSAPRQNEVLEVADRLARSLNDLSNGVTDVRQQVQKELEQSLDDLNRHLETIDTLNRQIRGETNLGNTAPDLEDDRDTAMEAVTKLVDAKFMRKGDGTIDVMFSNGQPLLEGSYEALSTDKTTLDAQSAYPATIPAIRLGDPTTGTDVTSYLRGGRLGALVDLRDNQLPRYQAQLDEFAQKLSAGFDSADLTLFTDGAGTVPASAPATGYVGYASRIQVNSVVQDTPSLLRDGTGGGAGTTSSSELLRTVVDDVLGGTQTFTATGLGPLGTLNTKLPTTGTFATFAKELVSYQGNQRADAETREDSATSLRDQLKTRLTDQAGVNVDVEMSNMIELQRSYASSAKVITANRQMFDDLISILR